MTDDTQPQPVRRARRARPWRRYAIIALAVIAVAIGIAWEVHDRLTHVYESDARIMADLVTMSSRSEGWVTELKVMAGDRVAKGDILALIDGRDVSLSIEGLEAKIAEAESRRQQLLMERELAEQQTSARYDTRVNDAEAAAAQMEILDAERDLAQEEFNRARRLQERGVATRQLLDRTQAELRQIENRIRQARAQTAAARNEIVEAEADRTQLAVIDAQLPLLDHQVAQYRAELERARLDLADRQIRAPSDAVIDRVFIDKGEYVDSGQRILMLHDPSRLWIEANIKETSIRELYVGQPVRVHVDAFPDRDLRGEVQRVGTSTTSNFALLPSPNPSGNFTKITQRIPVRIGLEETDQPLSPGMMVEIAISLTDRP